MGFAADRAAEQKRVDCVASSVLCTSIACSATFDVQTGSGAAGGFIVSYHHIHCFMKSKSV